eukprot:2622236-Pyramimonas_sp.AAC.1
MHPGMPPDALEALDLIVSRTKSIAGRCSAVLSCYPELVFRRAPRGLRPRLLRDPSWHDWLEVEPGVAWRCRRCCTVVRGADRPTTGCTGLPTAIQKLRGAELRGH